ncbi:MAG TPA: hypothetical protein VK431_07035 [Nitrosopumilaceae archaeon]|nr:hypothetical protein [Nitrosopumilaceae archaeon]
MTDRSLAGGPHLAIQSTAILFYKIVVFNMIFITKIEECYRFGRRTKVFLM